MLTVAFIVLGFLSLLCRNYQGVSAFVDTWFNLIIFFALRLYQGVSFCGHALLVCYDFSLSLSRCYPKVSAFVDSGFIVLCFFSLWVAVIRLCQLLLTVTFT